MQTWLPRAYGQSTAESAGLLAAVALNLAFYGMLRTWFDLLGDPAVWWAVVALLAGSVTALLGILGGIVQARLREFIAYSSIENAGIIVTALGIALMGSAAARVGPARARPGRRDLPDHRSRDRQGRAVHGRRRGRALGRHR